MIQEERIGSFIRQIGIDLGEEKMALLDSGLDQASQAFIEALHRSVSEEYFFD